MRLIRSNVAAENSSGVVIVKWHIWWEFTCISTFQQKLALIFLNLPENEWTLSDYDDIKVFITYNYKLTVFSFVYYDIS